MRRIVEVVSITAIAVASCTFSYYLGTKREKAVEQVSTKESIVIRPTGGDDTQKLIWAVTNPYHIPVTLADNTTFYVCTTISIRQDVEVNTLGAEVEDLPTVCELNSVDIIH